MIDIINEGGVLVAYISANGREACVDKDPMTSGPFGSENALKTYAETIEAAYMEMEPPPEQAQPMPDRREWHPYDFWQRFNSVEQAALIEASRTDFNIENFRMQLLMISRIISDNPVTVAGMAYLVTAGLISEDRKNEIMGGE